MKTTITTIIVLLLAFTANAQLNFYPEDPMQDPPPAECITTPYQWTMNPTGSTNKCANEDFNVTGLFNDPDNLGQLYWVNGITSAVMGTGQTLVSTGLTQTTTIHCEYRIPTGHTCSGKYVADYVVNISNCTPTPINEAVDVPKDVIWTGSEFVTTGGTGNISVINLYGSQIQNILLNSGQNNYQLVKPESGIYLLNISYNGKQSITKIYIQ